MNVGITIFNQIIKMFIMMITGYGIYKHALIDSTSVPKLSNILLYLATPCTIINSFNQAFSASKFNELIMCFLISIAVYLLNIVIAKILYKKNEEIERFCVVFSNAGFMGIPLVTGLFGSEAVFYISPFIVGFYLFVWTYGIIEMSGDKNNVTFKKVISNPSIWAVFIGLFIFLLPVKPYEPIMGAINTLGGMNTPLAMIILGTYLAKERPIDLFNSIKMYKISFIRLLVIPAVYVLLFNFLNVSETIKTVILIAACAPVGSTAPIFAQMFNKDAAYAAKVVCLSTILSLITMPAILSLANYIW